MQPISDPQPDVPETTKPFLDYPIKDRLQGVIAEFGPISLKAACELAGIAHRASEATEEEKHFVQTTFEDEKIIKEELDDEEEKYVGYRYDHTNGDLEKIRKETNIPSEVLQERYLDILSIRIESLGNNA